MKMIKTVLAARKKILNGSAAVAIGVMAAAGFSSTVHAKQMKKQHNEQVEVYLVKYGTRNSFNYTKKTEIKVEKISRREYRKRNSYVCTPSGFGQKARCYTPGLVM